MAMNPNNSHNPTMPFTPAQSQQASNAAIVPVFANVSMDVDFEDSNAKAVAAAQEQLRLAMEAQARVLKNRDFADAYWRDERAEARTMRISDKAAIVDTMEEVVMMLEMRWNHVSLCIVALPAVVDLISATGYGACVVDARGVIGAFPCRTANGKLIPLDLCNCYGTENRGWSRLNSQSGRMASGNATAAFATGCSVSGSLWDLDRSLATSARPIRWCARLTKALGLAIGR